MKALNQIIVNSAGHSFLHFWSMDEKFVTSLNEILSSMERCENKFYVIEKDGTVRAGQRELHLALRYMSEDRILVHKQEGFIPFLGWNESQIPMLLKYEERIRKSEEYTAKVWEVYEAK